MNLHGQIMNLRRDKYPHNLNRDDVLMAYRMGFRDARRDAAELALKADAERDELRGALRALMAAKWRTPEYESAVDRAVVLVSG